MIWTQNIIYITFLTWLSCDCHPQIGKPVVLDNSSLHLPRPVTKFICLHEINFSAFRGTTRHTSNVRSSINLFFLKPRAYVIHHESISCHALGTGTHRVQIKNHVNVCFYLGHYLRRTWWLERWLYWLCLRCLLLPDDGRQVRIGLTSENESEIQRR